MHNARLTAGRRRASSQDVSHVHHHMHTCSRYGDTPTGQVADLRARSSARIASALARARAASSSPSPYCGRRSESSIAGPSCGRWSAAVSDSALQPASSKVPGIFCCAGCSTETGAGGGEAAAAALLGRLGRRTPETGPPVPTIGSPVSATVGSRGALSVPYSGGTGCARRAGGDASSEEACGRGVGDKLMP